MIKHNTFFHPCEPGSAKTYHPLPHYDEGGNTFPDSSEEFKRKGVNANLNSLSRRVGTIVPNLDLKNAASPVPVSDSEVTISGKSLDMDYVETDIKPELSKYHLDKKFFESFTSSAFLEGETSQTIGLP